MTWITKNSPQPLPTRSLTAPRSRRRRLVSKRRRSGSPASPSLALYRGLSPPFRTPRAYRPAIPSARCMCVCVCVCVRVCECVVKGKGGWKGAYPRDVRDVPNIHTLTLTPHTMTLTSKDSTPHSSLLPSLLSLLSRSHTHTHTPPPLPPKHHLTSTKRTATRSCSAPRSPSTAPPSRCAPRTCR